MNEQITITSLLVLHLMLAAVFILYGIKKKHIAKVHLFWILFIPLFGPLAGLCIAFEQGREKDLKALDGLINRAGQDAYFTVQETEANVVPAEEALLIDDAQNKRKMMMNILRTESKQYLDLLLLARYNQDTEVSHFATATIMQVQHDFQMALQNRQAAVSKNQNDMEAWFAYIQVLDDYIASGLLEGSLLARQRRELTLAIEQVRHHKGGSNLLELCARNYLAQNQVIDAVEAAESLIELRPADEKSWLLRLDICVKARDEKGLVQLLSRIERANIDWSTQGREYLNYWREEQR